MLQINSVKILKSVWLSAQCERALSHSSLARSQLAVCKTPKILIVLVYEMIDTIPDAYELPSKFLNQALMLHCGCSFSSGHKSKVPIHKPYEPALHSLHTPHTTHKWGWMLNTLTAQTMLSLYVIIFVLTLCTLNMGTDLRSVPRWGSLSTACCASVDMHTSCAVRHDLLQHSMWLDPLAVSPSMRGSAHYMRSVGMYLALFVLWIAKASIQACMWRPICAH